MSKMLKNVKDIQKNENLRKSHSHEMCTWKPILAKIDEKEIDINLAPYLETSTTSKNIWPISNMLKNFNFGPKLHLPYFRKNIMQLSVEHIF